MRFYIINICMSTELLENPLTLSIIIILRCLTKYRLKLSFGADANVCIFKTIPSKFIEYTNEQKCMRIKTGIKSVF